MNEISNTLDSGLRRNDGHGCFTGFFSNLLKVRATKLEKEIGAAKHAVVETTGKLHEVEEQKRSQDRSARQAQQISECETKNVRLQELGQELLQKYADKGVFDTLLKKEPFTQLKRVEMENLV